MNFISVRTLKIILFTALVVISVVSFPTILSAYQNAEQLIQNAGSYGPLIYMAFMIAAILIAPIPASPLAIMAGLLFGPWKGMIYTLISATVGAVVAFLLARFFLQDFFKKQLEKNIIYRRIEGKSGRNLAYIIGITRLMPQISFDIVSFAAGLTSINLWLFTLVTFTGMIPIVFILSFFGHFLAQYQAVMIIILLALFIFYLLSKVRTLE